MPSFTFNISVANLQRVKDACEARDPIPRDEDNNPLYTSAQWAKEVGRRFYISRVYWNENRIAMESVAVERDDTLIDP